MENITMTNDCEKEKTEVYYTEKFVEQAKKKAVKEFIDKLSEHSVLEFDLHDNPYHIIELDEIREVYKEIYGNKN